MCGIIGLHLRTPELESELGVLASRMLEAMTDRGPDSAGIAIYEDAPGGVTKYSLRSPEVGYDWAELGDRLDAEVRLVGTDAILSAAGDPNAGLGRLESAALELVS